MWFRLSSFFLLTVVVVAIQGAQENLDPLSKYETYEEEIYGNRRPARNFDNLKLGGGYGVAKRLFKFAHQQKTAEKPRRGPLNGLIPGGAFGRASRSNFIKEGISSPINYDSSRKMGKLLKGTAPIIQSSPEDVPLLTIGRNDDWRLLNAFSDDGPSSVDLNNNPPFDWIQDK